METITLLTVGILNIACFLLGAKVGQQVSKGDPIETPKVPNLNPFNYYREHEEKKAAQEEAEKIETILENIERYDGTSNGQKDVR